MKTARWYCLLCGETGDTVKHDCPEIKKIEEGARKSRPTVYNNTASEYAAYRKRCGEEQSKG